jgi:predicted transcriptional regulator
MQTASADQAERKACIVRLPTETHRALRRVAFERETSMQRLMEDAIGRWVRELDAMDARQADTQHPNNV